MKVFERLAEVEIGIVEQQRVVADAAAVAVEFEKTLEGHWG